MLHVLQQGRLLGNRELPEKIGGSGLALLPQSNDYSQFSRLRSEMTSETRLEHTT